LCLNALTNFQVPGIAKDAATNFTASPGINGHKPHSKVVAKVSPSRLGPFVISNPSHGKPNKYITTLPKNNAKSIFTYLSHPFSTNLPIKKAATINPIIYPPEGIFQTNS